MPRGVYRRPAMADRFWTKVDKTGNANGCWLWTGETDQDGYGRFNPNEAGIHYQSPAPKVSWYLSRGSWPPKGDVIGHKCDHPRCVRPSHLMAITQQANMDDKEKKGRQAKGHEVMSLDWKREHHYGR